MTARAQMHVGGEPPRAAGTVTAGLRDIGLYVHLPWCVRKCPYCDFNSHALRGTVPEQEYVRALLDDLAQDAPLLDGRRVCSIFLGGGTPSVFSGEAIGRLLEGVRGSLGPEAIAARCEITLEANPGASDAARFAQYRAAGVNRLSVGVQSFDPGCLQRIGRIHDGREARRAVEAALGCGFDSVNVDLMFALPGQSRALALEDVATALALGAGHVSHYQLTVEPNTAFHRAPPVLPDDDAAWEMQQRCSEVLERAGLERYEISAWARAGQQCAHNLNYWSFGDYGGIGAGAHDKLTAGARPVVSRRIKHRHPARYMESAGAAQRVLSERRVERSALALEFMMNALRLVKGVPRARLREATGIDPESLGPTLAALEDEGLLAADPRRLRPTGRGLRYLDSVLERFVPQAAKRAPLL